MPALPSSLALSGWPVDGSAMVAAPGRTDLAAIQTAVNAIIALFSNGSVAGDLMIWDASALKWIAYSSAPTASKIGSARAKSSVAQSLNSATLTVVTLAATDWANGGLTLGTNAVIVPLAGVYRVGFQVAWASSGAGTRYVEIHRQNGLGVDQESFAHRYKPDTTAEQMAGIEFNASAGDSFYIKAYQDSGAPLNLTSAYLTVTKIG